jgi:vesicular inhibitory amino acid transporter
VGNSESKISRTLVEFGIKRVLVRTGMMLLVMLVAEAVPNFGPVLNLIGSTSMTLMFLVYPCTIYLFLTASIREARDENRPPKVVSFKKFVFSKFSHYLPHFRMIKKNNKFMILLCAFLILFGIVGGAVATYSAWVQITATKFQMPCFVRPFMHKK